jgi:hypothetical protein
LLNADNPSIYGNNVGHEPDVATPGLKHYQHEVARRLIQGGAADVED